MPHASNHPVPGEISLTYSLADQSFTRTKSLGILNFSVQLLRQLAQRPECSPLTVLTNESLRERLSLPERVRQEYHERAATGGAGRMWWDQLGVYAAARRTGNEWLLLPKGFASFVRRRCPVRLAVFVHDLMHDHYEKHHPQQRSSAEALYFRTALRASLRQAEVVFTQSEFVRQEVEAFARKSGAPLPRFVCCGRGFERPASHPVGERRNIVVLASRFPHKQTPLAVDFLSRWQKQAAFTGEVHWVGALPEGMVLPAFPGWHQHPRLPDAAYQDLMARAQALLFFSDYEGFGLPPVEAVLAGVCPVYSDIPATREVMGGRGYAFGNADFESFKAALNRSLTAVPGELEQWGNELLARHHWGQTADRIVAALAFRG